MVTKLLSMLGLARRAGKLESGFDAAVIAAACSKVDECERALAYNVSPETCLDTLLFDVREVVHGSGRTD